MMEPPSHQQGRVADAGAQVRPLEQKPRRPPPRGLTPAATCSSWPVAPAASCALADAARTAVGRRAHCRPAATPRSCHCTRGAAAAPTCGPALPCPSRRTTRREAMERGRRRDGEEEATGRGNCPLAASGPHLLQRVPESLVPARRP